MFEVAKYLLYVLFGDSNLVSELKGQVRLLGNDLLKQFEIPLPEYAPLDLLQERIDQQLLSAH